MQGAATAPFLAVMFMIIKNTNKMPLSYFTPAVEKTIPLLLSSNADTLLFQSYHRQKNDLQNGNLMQIAETLLITS